MSPRCWVLEVLGGCPCEADVLGKGCFVVSSEGCFEVQELRPHWLVVERRQVILPPENFPRQKRACMIWADLESGRFSETSLQQLRDVALQAWDERPLPLMRAGPFVVAPLQGMWTLERNLLSPLVPRARPFGTLACGFSLDSLSQEDEAKRISTLVFEVRDGRAIMTGRSTIEVDLREGFTTNFEGRFHLQALLSEEAPDGSHILLSLTRGASQPEWTHWLRNLPPRPFRDKAWIPHPSDGFVLPDPFKSAKGREAITPILPAALLEQVQEQLVTDEGGLSSEPKMFLSLLHASPPRSMHLCFSGGRREDYMSLQAQVLCAHPDIEAPGATFALCERVETVRVHVHWDRARCFVNIRRKPSRSLTQLPVLAVLSLARHVNSETSQVHWSRALSARQAAKWIPRDGFVYPLSRQSVSDAQAGISPALSRILASEATPSAQDGQLSVSLVYSASEG
jgi:hypothetical protein